MSFFDGGFGALLTAGAGIAGGLMASNAQSAANKEAFKYTAKLNQMADQRAFNNSKALFEYQQSNAVPLQYKAMKRAGINPILAVGGISGGSMPNAQGTGATMQPPDVGSGYRSAAASVADAVRFWLDKQNAESQINLNAANAAAVQSRMENDNELTRSRIHLDSIDAIGKLELHRKAKAEVKGLLSAIELNNLKKEVMNSEVALNAAKIRDIALEREYKNATKNQAGLPFGIYSYRFGDDKGPFPFLNPLKQAGSDIADISKNFNRSSIGEKNLERMERYWESERSERSRWKPIRDEHGHIIGFHRD